MIGFEDEPHEQTSDALWPAVSDLMACLFGIFVLFFVWAIALEVDLTRQVEVAKAEHKAETNKRERLEQALAKSGAFADGRVTLRDGRIGIGGSVLFRLGSAELQPDARALFEDLSKALAAYLAKNPDELIMVSGFTDDRPLQRVTGTELGAAGFRDNWELSSARALTVVRELVVAGLPKSRVFAAGFGDTHPVASNSDDEGRAKNRRVEISAVPSPTANVDAARLGPGEDRGRSPESTDRGRSPESTDRGRSPESTDRGRSPESTDRGRSPESTDRGRSPVPAAIDPTSPTNPKAL